MDLRKYFDLFWRRKLLIIAATVVTIAVVGAGTHYITPVYEASTVLRIAMSAGGPLDYSDYLATNRLMNTYVEIATSRPVVEELMKRLNLTRTPILTAEIIPNTELIKITVEETSPKKAAAEANTLAEILIAQSSQIYIGGGKKLTEVLSEQLAQIQADVEGTQQDYEKLLIQTPAPRERIEAEKQLLSLKQANYANLLSQYEQARFREEIQSSMITIWETADIPVKPSKPNVILNYVLGLAAGFIGGVGLLLVFENLDTTLHTTEEIETVSELSAFTKIPKVSKKQIYDPRDESSPLADAFRNMALKIHQNKSQKPGEAILVMSALPNEGKSTVVFHLAFSLAEFGKNVVVIDCDTRIARLHSLFNLSNQCGLTDVLEQKVSLEEALQKSSREGLTVLTSGSLSSRPSLLLGSPHMTRLVARLRQQFDYILLDTPALLAVADATELVPFADKLILVARRGYAKREGILRMGKFLKEIKIKSIYLVVNHAEDLGRYGYYQYGRRTKPIPAWFRKIQKKEPVITAPAGVFQSTNQEDPSRSKG